MPTGIIVYYNIFPKNNLNFSFYLLCINGHFPLIGLTGLDDLVILNETFFYLSLKTLFIENG